MKGKVFNAGLMILLSLSLLSCGSGNLGGASGGAPGSTNGDSTGIIINSVSIKSDSTPPPNPNIDVFTTSTTGLTSEVVTINIDAVSRNDTGLSDPFPATVSECTITYLKAIEDPSSPSIPSLTIFPNCILLSSTALSSTADKTNTCTVTLIDIQREQDYWTAINQGLNPPSEYPTHYVAQYNCKFRGTFEKDGYFQVGYDFWMANFPLVSPVPVGSVAVSANPVTVASGGTSTISAYVTTNVGDPVPDNTTVNFTSTAGSLGTPFAQTTNGVATTTFTAPTLATGAANQNVIVTASVGGKSGATSVTVTATPALTITPGSATVNVSSASKTVNFAITGGTPGAGYTTSSSDSATAFNDNGAGGGISGDGLKNGTEGGIWTGPSIIVTVPAGTPTGTATLTVTDSVGGIKTATITIVGPLAVGPPLASVVGATGGKVTFTVSGGTPPYVADYICFNSSGVTTVICNSVDAFCGPTSTNFWNTPSIQVTVPAGTLPDICLINVTDFFVGSPVTAQLNIN